MDANTITAWLVPFAVLAFIALPMVARWRRKQQTQHRPNTPQVEHDRSALRFAAEQGRIPDQSIMGHPGRRPSGGGC